MNLKTFSLKCLLAGLIILTSLGVTAQKHPQIDSLLRQLHTAKDDTGKVDILIKLRAYTFTPKPDSALYYLQQGLSLAQKLKWQKGISTTYQYLGVYYYDIPAADYAKAQKYSRLGVETGLKQQDNQVTFHALEAYEYAMSMQKKYPETLSYLNSMANHFKQTGHRRELAETYMLTGECYQNQFNYNAATDYFEKGTAIEQADHKQYLANYQILNMAYAYMYLHNTKKARDILTRAGSIYLKNGDPKTLADYYQAMAETYNRDDNYKLAIANYEKSIQIEEKNNLASDDASNNENAISWEYFLIKDYDKAYDHVMKSVALAKGDSSALMYAYSTLASIYREAPASIVKKAGLKPGQQYQKSAELLVAAIKFGKSHINLAFANENMPELSKSYEKMGRFADALKVYKTYITQKDSLDSLTNEKAVVLKEAQFDYNRKADSLRYQQTITDAQLKQKKQQSYFFIGGIIALVILSVFIALNYNNQRKSNKLLGEANNQLSEQREEITAQRDQLVETVANLKTAQTQLIQAEKMASLGELTAGIAHEIQNPLNFVNNFSEVSRELIDEMQNELRNGDKDEAIAISEDVKQNLEKIHHHGQRADGIVKGMLEHSRASTGQKELTDLNKLADEYLRLAYHGLRAKDKSFNAELVTHFDPNLPPVNIIPQDIGRVLLNMYNNAFYATQQKQKSADEGYKPIVEIISSQSGNNINIKVKDNGTGIPDNVKEKIMQPFFTTKPTGQGTGLGLSLSYDIIVKGHGGIITVNSIPGEGAEFVIELPFGG